MLKEAALAKISTLLKIDAAKLKAAMADEKEADIEIPEDLTILNKTELESRDRNKYGEGKKAGEEMLIKGIKTKHALEFTGEDSDKLIEAVTKKVKAELDTNPDARLAEKDKELKKAKDLLKEANDKADGFKTHIDQMAGDNKLLAMLPSNRLETMTNEEYLDLTKRAVKIEVRDGKEVAIRNGEVVVDTKTMNPIAPTEVIKTYYAERKWIKEPVDPKMAGRGGGNSSGGGTGITKFAKLSEVQKQLEEEGINLNGEVAMQRISAAQKENPEMDLRS